MKECDDILLESSLLGEDVRILYRRLVCIFNLFHRHEPCTNIKLFLSFVLYIFQVDHSIMLSLSTGVARIIPDFYLAGLDPSSVHTSVFL